MNTGAFNRLIGRGLGLAKRAYQSLPLNYESKAAHRRAVARLFPKLLLLSGAQRSSIPALAPAPGHLATGMPAGHIDPDLASLQLDVRSSSHPLVSIVIPVFGQIEYTTQCLASITANTPTAAFEVIVVDDCSPDKTSAVLARINGIRLIRNAENQGFIRSCNAGAAIARGQYIHFLNNDTVVTRGWLDELLTTFDDFPGTGFVGSKLIYPDGRLQEAGAIIWRDGSAWNFGRDQDAALPIYNYAREVDYCSGASIVVPKSLFDELGGFDERYLPAYCEDSDLALRVRAAGYRVLYQPLSTVVHYEGITSGTDPAKGGVKAHQIANTKRLFERWHEQLKSHQAPGQDPDRAKDRTAQQRVLVLDHCTPTPDQDAGSVLVFNMLLLLREMDFQVTFIPEDDLRYVPGYTTELQASGIEVLWAPHVVSVRAHLKEYGGRYDLVLLFRPAVVGRNVKAVRKYCPNATVLFHTHDLHFLRMQREAELSNDKKKMKLAASMKELEFAAIRAADVTIVVSTTECELLQRDFKKEQICVFPLIVSARGTQTSFQDRADVVFIGGYKHTPNIDAVRYFVSEIMPLLRERLPGIRFYAAGSNPTSDVQSLAGEDVVVPGYIENLDPFLDRIRVSVAPLRYGAGIKGKIASAMAVGLPVVATTIAVEGMSLTDEENVLVADGASEFVSSIVRLYEDESAWNRLSRNGVVFAENAWGAEAAWKNLSDILAPLGFRLHRNGRPLRLHSSVSAARHPSSNGSVHLSPIFIAHDRSEFERGVNRTDFAATNELELRIAESASDDIASFDAFCVPCNSPVPLQIVIGPPNPATGRRNPNWRETLTCPQCGMNNRQRMVATLVRERLDSSRNKAVYLMEQVAPIYWWAVTAFPQHHIVGSEYLGSSYEGGQTSKGVRHEDAMKLSFLDKSLDLIISNDVFEHVPQPARAFSECARVLRQGGTLLATIPFHDDYDDSVVRARLEEGGLRHLLPPEFHGNPLSRRGSLVFTDFGWDVLTMARGAGFEDVHVAAYVSDAFGHLGGLQLVFVASKVHA